MDYVCSLHEQYIYKNGDMTLRLVAFYHDSAVFARLNKDGTVNSFIYAYVVSFGRDKQVSWGHGSYDLTEKQAMKKLYK